MTDQAGSWFDRRTVLACGALLVAALPFAALLLLVVSSWSPLQGLDRAVSEGLHGYAIDHPAFTTVMRVVTDTGSSLAWIVLLVPVFGWLAAVPAATPLGCVRCGDRIGQRRAEQRDQAAGGSGQAAV